MAVREVPFGNERRRSEPAPAPFKISYPALPRWAALSLLSRPSILAKNQLNLSSFPSRNRNRCPRQTMVLPKKLAIHTIKATASRSGISSRSHPLCIELT